jgi:hypothetical protein
MVASLEAALREVPEKLEVVPSDDNKTTKQKTNYEKKNQLIF